MEYASSTRTWLLTLTNNPTRHAHQLALVRRYLAKQGVDYDGLDYGEQFALRAAEMGKEVTKFLKRLRKNSAAPFRYLAVTEMHQNGAPHVHLLLHEQDVARPLRKDMIQSCWHDGFSNAKLVKDVRQAVYVCKYLSKTKVARVRASLKYGSNEHSVVRTEPSLMTFQCHPSYLEREIRPPKMVGVGDGRPQRSEDGRSRLSPPDALARPTQPPLGGEQSRESASGGKDDFP